MELLSMNNYRAKLKYELRIPLFLIWKYLSRGNKWTLFFIIFLMAVAFINLVFITSLFNGIIETTNNQTINNLVGNITLLPEEGKEYIENSESLVKEIDSTNNVVGASFQFTLPATLKYKNYQNNGPILAIDPNKEKLLTGIAQSIIGGSYLDENDTNKIIIGRQIAGGKDVEMNAFSLQGVKVGDKIKIIINNQEFEFIVKGIFYTKFIEADKRAFITHNALEKINPNLKDKSTNIVIKINKKGEEDKIIQELKDKKIKGKFYTWQEMGGLMKTITKSFISINVLLTFVGILIAAITIFIVIYVDITNKKRQIGILRAIGIRPYLIHFTYLLQTVIYSCLGVILGIGIFYLMIVPYFKFHPFALPIGDVSLFVDPLDFIGRAEIIIWVSIFAGLVPAIFATRAELLNSILGK